MQNAETSSEKVSNPVMSITAVIPVKGSSSRLPGKNILPFGSDNLLTHKIRQLKQVSKISEVLVSSDSDAMLHMAQNENVRAIKRPIDLANESRPFGDLVRHITGFLSTEHLMWTPVTSPTLDSNFYTEAINMYFDAVECGFDSLTTTIPFRHFLLDADGPLNFKPFDSTNAITNSDELPEVDLWTCGCSIISTKLAYDIRYIFGVNPYRYRVSPYHALDIDTQFDYDIAKFMWEKDNGKQ